MEKTRVKPTIGVVSHREKADNSANGYISHMLSWVWNGWLSAFSQLPEPFFLPNSESINVAPASSADDHQKTVDMKASVAGFSRYVSPVLSVVRPHEVFEARDALQQLGLWDDATMDLEHIDPINAAINQFSSQFPQLKAIKSRTCIDYSRRINNLLYAWHYSATSIQDGLSLLRKHGFMAKLDISRMFLQVPLHPKARKYLAYRLPDQTGKLVTWVPTRTPMGASPVPGLANTLTSEISRVLHAKGVPNTIMTDDIFLVGDTFQECQERLTIAIEVLQKLGWSP